eukprot:COSAG01_NODE_4128_length_5325_cov_4.201493_5_plen_132_part_00
MAAPIPAPGLRRSAVSARVPPARQFPYPPGAKDKPAARGKKSRWPGALGETPSGDMRVSHVDACLSCVAGAHGQLLPNLEKAAVSSESAFARRLFGDYINRAQTRWEGGCVWLTSWCQPLPHSSTRRAAGT